MTQLLKPETSTAIPHTGMLKLCLPVVVKERSRRHLQGDLHFFLEGLIISIAPFGVHRLSLFHGLRYIDFI